MKRLLLFASVIVVLLATGAWLVLRPATGTAPARASGATAPVEPASAAAADPAVELEPALAVPEDQQQGAAATALRRDASQRNFDPALARRVRGVLSLPDSVPADEELSVVAYKSDKDPRSRLRSASNLEDIERLADARPDASGGFELALPPDVDRVWLVLEARYLRQLQALEVATDDPSAAPRLETELGAWITGRLVPPRGVELEVEELEALKVTWAPGELSDFTQVGRGSRTELEPIEVKLDAAQAFEFRGVQAVTSGDLRVVPKTLAAHKSARIAPKPGQHVIVDLPLVRGGTLVGRVLDERGVGVAEAKLTVEVDPVMMGRGGFEVREGESAADGSFTLSAVRVGKLTLAAEADGHLDARLDLELIEGEARADLLLELRLGNAIAGVVRWPDGRFAEDAAVNATFDMANLGGMGAFNAMTGPKGDDHCDAQGAFKITGLGKGPFTVTASAKADDGVNWSVRLDDVKPETLDLELKLAQPLGLTGRVVDENGDPVTDFRVVAKEKTGGMIPGLGAQSVSHTYKDEQGQFLLEGLSERTWIVMAMGSGAGAPYARGEPLEVVLPAASEDSEIRLVLPHSATVSGSVLSPEGRPLGGAQVALQLGLQGLASLGSDRSSAPTATSADDGTFVLAGLTPGALSLTATAEGFAKSVAVPVDVPPGGQVQDVLLTLRRGGRILGEIYAADGSLQAGATIMAQTPTDLSSQRWDTSDSDGKFDFENVTPGTWQVMTMPGQKSMENVDGENFADFFAEMKFQMAEVIEGEEVHVVLGGRPADPVKVSGRVLVDDVPQVGALVNFMHDGSSGNAGATPFKFTTTGKDGRYALDLDSPGGYLVQVQKLQGSAGQQQSVQLHYDLPAEAEQTLDLHLPVGSISGLVRGPDGQPQGGARITLAIEGGVSNLTFGGGQYAEISSDDEGHYSLVWLREGTYTVAAGGPLMGGLFGGGDDAPAREVRAGLKLRDGQHVQGVDFRLRTPGRLTGTVKDSAGKPVEGAAVFVRDENGQLLERISMASTDSAGRFTYSGIGAGKFLVHARSTTQVSAEAQVQVREGEDVELQLVVDPGSILLVMLSDGDGNPVDCTVTVTDDDGRQVNGNWSMADLMALFNSGSFTSKEQRVGPVPAGRYTIHASTADGLSATKRVTVSGQDERKVNLRLKE